MSSDVETEFSCGICQTVYVEPVSLQCGHIFCRACVEGLEATGHHSCPNCRKSVDMKHLTEEWTLEEKIKKMSITCPHCQAMVKLMKLNVHQQLCPQGQSSAGAVQVKQEARPMSVAASLVQGIERKPLLLNRHTFNCPVCMEKNLSQEGLLRHVMQQHRQEKTAQVVCPICAAMPWGKGDQASGNFIQHIELRHKFEYDRFVDFSKNDDEQLRAAIENSKADF